MSNNTALTTMNTLPTATKRRRPGFPFGVVALLLTIIYMFQPEPPQHLLDGSIKVKSSSWSMYSFSRPWQDDKKFNLTNDFPVADDDEFFEFLVTSSDPATNESLRQRLYDTLTTNPFVVPKKSSVFNSRAVMFHVEEALLELENQTMMLQDSTPVSSQMGNETEQFPMALVGKSFSTPDGASEENATMPSNTTMHLRRTR